MTRPLSTHRRRPLGTVLVAAALACAAGGALAQTAPAPAPGDEPVPAFDAATLANADYIKAGETVWTTQCRHCHGASAYPGKAPKLRPGMLEPDFIWDRVTYGFKGMPSWRTVFTPEERRAVVVYIKSSSFSP